VLEVDKRQENNVLNENIDTKSLTQELNQQGKFDVLVMQGARLTPLEKKKIDKECRQFLELLEGE
jgi:carbamoylphosphate synthase small subunit